MTNLESYYQIVSKETVILVQLQDPALAWRVLHPQEVSLFIKTNLSKTIAKLRVLPGA